MGVFTQSIQNRQIIEMVGVTLWTPAVLGSDLAIWFRGDTLTGSDQDLIAQWNDQSGNARHATQSTDANKPKLEVAELNGKNVVGLPGSPRYFTLPNLSSFGSNSGSLFEILKSNDPDDLSSGGPQYLGTSGNVNHYPFSGTIYNGDMSTTRQTVGDPSASLANWHLASFRSAASDFKYHMNGTQFFSTGTNTVGWGSSPVLGHGGNITYALKGMIAEWVLVVPALTVGSSNWLKMEGYLVWNWNIPSVLDSGHLYRNAAPTL